MTKIIVDSNCDLTKELLKKYKVKTLPLRILIKDVEYLDKRTIKIGSVLGSHFGIGSVGVFFLNDKNKLYIN